MYNLREVIGTGSHLSYGKHVSNGLNYVFHKQVADIITGYKGNATNSKFFLRRAVGCLLNGIKEIQIFWYFSYRLTLNIITRYLVK